MSATKTKKTTKTKATRKAAKSTRKATSEAHRFDREQHRGDRRRRQEAEGQEGEAQEAQRPRRRGTGARRERPANEHTRDDRDARGQETLDEPRRQDAACNSLFSNTQGDQREGEGRPVREDGAREVRRQRCVDRSARPDRRQRPTLKSSGRFLIRRGPGSAALCPVRHTRAVLLPVGPMANPDPPDAATRNVGEIGGNVVRPTTNSAPNGS